MNDKQLRAYVADRVEDGSIAGGFNLAVVAKRQPTQQGISFDGQIFVEKLFDTPTGWAGSQLEHITKRVFEATEYQWLEAHFQISCQIIQDPRNQNQPTPLDVMRYVRAYLMHRVNVERYQRDGLGVYLASQIRGDYQQDDRDRQEMYPSFDIVFVYQSPITLKVPGTDIVMGDEYSV